MKEILLIVAVLPVFLLGYFIMRRLDQWTEGQAENQGELFLEETVQDSALENPVLHSLAADFFLESGETAQEKEKAKKNGKRKQEKRREKMAGCVARHL